MAYFLLLIGCLIVALVLIYLMLWGGLGVILSLTYYDARANIEYLTGMLSAASSFYGNFSFNYYFPVGVKCKLDITEDAVSMKIPSGAVFKSETEIEIKKETELKLSITKPEYVAVKPFSIECDPQGQKILKTFKDGNEVKFEI